jgi:ribosomal-protein-alanine N-acetyltransferase
MSSFIRKIQQYENCKISFQLKQHHIIYIKIIGYNGVLKISWWVNGAPLTGVKMNIRWFDFDKDLNALSFIETGSDKDTWNVNDFEERLRQKSITCLVAEEDGVIVGFVLYELFLRRLSLIRIGVLPTHRRKGIGSALLKELKDKLSNKRNLISGEVRETNLSMQLFLKSQGFKAVEVIRVYYPNTDEDAFVFHYKKDTSA